MCTYIKSQEDKGKGNFLRLANDRIRNRTRFFASRFFHKSSKRVKSRHNEAITLSPPSPLGPPPPCPRARVPRISDGPHEGSRLEAITRHLRKGRSCNYTVASDCPPPLLALSLTVNSLVPSATGLLPYIIRPISRNVITARPSPFLPAREFSQLLRFDPR